MNRFNLLLLFILSIYSINGKSIGQYKSPEDAMQQITKQLFTAWNAHDERTLAYFINGYTDFNTVKKMLNFTQDPNFETHNGTIIEHSVLSARIKPNTTERIDGLVQTKCKDVSGTEQRFYAVELSLDHFIRDWQVLHLNQVYP
uniref:DUF4440 domain-containing protein n=1 Tax=Caenorhabditis tropicalis TaxID=1561998 RepID=A0A1I7TRV8_9PELO